MFNYDVNNANIEKYIYGKFICTKCSKNKSDFLKKMFYFEIVLLREFN